MNMLARVSSTSSYVCSQAGFGEWLSPLDRRTPGLSILEQKAGGPFERGSVYPVTSISNYTLYYTAHKKFCSWATILVPALVKEKTIGSAWVEDATDLVLMCLCRDKE